MRKRPVRSVLKGPYPWWSNLFPPQRGYRWIYRTCLHYNVFYLVGGELVALPCLYLEPLPVVKVEPYWEHMRRIEQMRNDDTEKMKAGKWEGSTDPFLEGFPTINQFCTDTWIMKEKKAVPCIPCTISLTFFSGNVNLALNDKQLNRACYTSSTTVREALTLLEAHLAAGSAPWRYWKN